jgi:hypothetical protein
MGAWLIYIPSIFADSCTHANDPMLRPVLGGQTSLQGCLSPGLEGSPAEPSPISLMQACR